MKRSRIVFVAVLCALLLSAWFLFFSREKLCGIFVAQPMESRASSVSGQADEELVNATPAQSNPPPSKPDGKPYVPSLAALAIKGMLNTPIEFYGKIVDQYGVPIEGAKASIGAVDKFLGNGSDYVKISDSLGLFSIDGIHGAYLTVGVSKKGYDYFLEESQGAFRYGKQDPSLRPAPTKDNPAIFILRKKVQPETLHYVKRMLGIPKDGTPVEYRINDLKKARPQIDYRPEIKCDITLQCWVDYDNFIPNTHPRYDWRFRISVPGGGVQERTDPEWQFEAPAEGYQPYLEVSMSKELPVTSEGSEERWRKSFERHCFIKLPDGRYGRLHFRGYADGEPAVEIEAFTNPAPGSRNLEFDPEKAIKPRF